MIRRSPSFVIVEMPFEPSDVKQLKIPRTLIQVVLHYVYHLCRRFLRYQKKLLDDITLFDDGIKILDSFIPYEYLVAVSERELILLAKIEGDTLVPCDNIIRLRFKKRIDPKIIQNNLFYHLKYNTVSQDVLNFKAVKTTLGFTSGL